MTSNVLAAARSQTSSLPDDALRRVCEKIIEEVAERVVRHRVGNWTFRDVATWLGREPTDAIVQAGLSILADARGAPILEMHFLFFDPTDDAPSGDLIPDDVVQAAFETGCLVNPFDGNPIDNFERYIAPFFIPLNQLVEELTSERELANSNRKPRPPR